MYHEIWRCQEALVIYKKPGVSFHSEAGEPGLFETLRQNENGDSLYPVHRLDKVTSGLLVVARTAAANRQLCEQFAEGRVEKFYVALSTRKPRKKQGSISGDMGPARGGSWRLLQSRDNPARTQFVSYGISPGLRLFVVRPLTGKTHQIRVALKSLGAPILGDERYGGETADRTYLHAWSLGFELGGRFLRFREPPAEGEAFVDEPFVSTLAEMSPPWERVWPKA